MSNNRFIPRDYEQFTVLPEQETALITDSDMIKLAEACIEADECLFNLEFSSLEDLEDE